MNDYEKILIKMKKQKHQLRILINKITDYKQEIERLNRENEELKKIQCTFLGTGCKAEIERLHSIIKEAREYIKMNYPVCAGSELLEILDKENK